MIQSPPRTILEVFESLPEGTLAEVVNNQLVMSPAPTSKHQRVLRSIFRQIDTYVETHQLGEVFFAPLDVYLDEENVFEPDLVFISTERLHILKDNIYGAPDLVVEVLSPGTENRDKRDKKAVYEKYGVKEYWIANPVTKKVIGYRLEGNRFTEITSEDSVIESGLLNLTIRF
jgi:Uma2 family endonuclease